MLKADAPGQQPSLASSGAAASSLDSRIAPTPYVADYPHFGFFVEHLLELPYGLLTEIGIALRAAHLTPEKLVAMTREGVRQAMLDGEIALPAQIDPVRMAAAQAIVDQRVALFTADNLARLPIALVTALGVAFTNPTHHDSLRDGKLHPRDIARYLKSAVIVPPIDPPADAVRAALDLLAYYDLLTGDTLRRLPMTLIARVGLDISTAEVRIGRTETIAEDNKGVAYKDEMRAMTLDDLHGDLLDAAAIDLRIVQRRIRLPDQVDHALLTEIRAALVEPQQLTEPR